VNSLRGSSRGRYGQLSLLAVGLALVFTCLSALPAPASAATVSCNGKLSSDKSHHSENALTYGVTCSEDMLGYTIVSNRELAYFSTEVTVMKGQEVAEGEAFTCEGAIPGNGVGCYGKMTAGNTATGSISTSDELCEAAVQPRFWVVALTTQLKKEEPFPLTSEPFELGIRCKTLNAKAKAKAKAAKLCAKVGKARSKKAKSKARQRCKAAKAQAKRLRRA